MLDSLLLPPTDSKGCQRETYGHLWAGPPSGFPLLTLKNKRLQSPGVLRHLTCEMLLCTPSRPSISTFLSLRWVLALRMRYEMYLICSLSVSFSWTEISMMPAVSVFCSCSPSVESHVSGTERVCDKQQLKESACVSRPHCYRGRQGGPEKDGGSACGVQHPRKLESNLTLCGPIVHLDLGPGGSSGPSSRLSRVQDSCGHVS